MKLKSLVLGTAAGALAVTGVQAADLPIAPEPIDYVRVCDAFGPGYYFIPGTDTCLRIAGRIRADYNYFDFDAEGQNFRAARFGIPNAGRFSTGAPFGAFGTTFRGSNAYRFRARAYIYMDSRTNTEFGILRTFTEVWFTGDAGGGIGPGTNQVFGGSPFFQGRNDFGTTPAVTLWRAFIQLGGLTFGRTQSFYDFLDATYGSAQFFNANYSDTTTNVAAYTAVFGNGFSASLSVEDEVYRRFGGFPGSTFERRELVINPFGPNFFTPFSTVFDTTSNYAGNRIPDIVGNLRVDQGWGSAQIMGAGHHVQVAEISESEYGWAAGAGINVNVPFGSGTRVGVQGGYTKGALNYVAETPVGPGVADATIDAFGNLNLVTAWSVSGGFRTSFTPTVSFGVSAGYLDVDHDLTTRTRFSDGFFVDTTQTVFVDRDFKNLDVDAFLNYNAVPGLDLGLGVQWKRVMGLNGNTVVVDRDFAFGPDTTRVFTLADPDDLDAISVFARVQRTF